jgi:CDP-4-dehydro-6-deoxyglucose reductase, E1
MNHTFWIGVYPGLTAPMMDFVIETIEQALRSVRLRTSA